MIFIAVCRLFILVLLRGPVSRQGTCWNDGGSWWRGSCDLCYVGHVQCTERRT